MSPETTLDPEHWVDRHGDALYRYALVRLRQPDLAAELVQETFLEALRGRDAFAGRSSERTWLIGILKHKVVDHFRWTRRESTTKGAGVAEVDELAGGPLADLFDRRGRWKVSPGRWGGDPSLVLEQREFWAVFEGCMAKLPATLAEAFFLRELDGQSGEAICALAEITPANLWARLHRARLRLRECLERRWFGRPPRSAGPGPIRDRIAQGE